MCVYIYYMYIYIYIYIHIHICVYGERGRRGRGGIYRRGGEEIPQGVWNQWETGLTRADPQTPGQSSGCRIYFTRKLCNTQNY